MINSIQSAAPALQAATPAATTTEASTQSSNNYHEREERLESTTRKMVQDVGVPEERAETTRKRGAGEVDHGTFGVNFAEHTSERQTSLNDRKQRMLQNARK